MKEASLPDTGSQEIGLAEVLRALLARKCLLIVVPLVVGGIVAIASPVMPNVYHATAALAIREPEIVMEGEAPPLSIEMLRGITDSVDTNATLETVQRRLATTLELERSGPALHGTFPGGTR